MSGLLVVGAGGHGKVVADIARDCGRWTEIAFLDDKFPESKTVSEWSVVGRLTDAHKFKDRFPEAIVALGNNKLRLEVLNKLLEDGFGSPVLVHPDASLSRSCRLGAGTVVCAQAAIKIDTDIGLGVIVNAGATIGHDCVLGDGVHVSPGGRVSGGVNVGKCSWLGSGAIVKELVFIGKRVIVGAGTVVINNVPDQVTVVGVPGRIIKRNEKEETHQMGEYQ